MHHRHEHDYYTNIVVIMLVAFVGVAVICNVYPYSEEMFQCGSPFFFFLNQIAVC